MVIEICVIKSSSKKVMKDMLFGVPLYLDVGHKDKQKKKL
jgi:hypothetical protein